MEEVGKIKKMVKYVIIATVTGFLAGGGISLMFKLINKNKMKEFVQWIEEHVWNVFSGLICGLFAYLMPIRNIVILMLAFIIFDLITGIVAARKRGKR